MSVYVRRSRHMVQNVLIRVFQSDGDHKITVQCNVIMGKSIRS